MKAVFHDEYGGPEVLRLVERSRPRAGPGEVVVEVKASSLNSADVRMLRANPFLVRLFNGLLRPKKRRVLGQDVAGVVTEVGEGLTRFAVGDQVFGETAMDRDGAFAEACIAPEHTLALVPPGVRLEDAAAVPLAGTTALQALRAAHVVPGHRVFLAGAGGGVGLFAVQIARRLGARVTASCGPRSAQLLRSFGAEVIVDARTSPLELPGREFDAVIAINGYQPLSTYRRLLAKGGRYVMVGGSNAQLFEALLAGRLSFALTGRTATALTIDPKVQASDLERLGTWLRNGELTVVVDRSVTLAQVRETIAAVERGQHVRGKIIVTP